MVVYDAYNNEVWASIYAQKPYALFNNPVYKLQGDGNLVVYASDNMSPKWAGQICNGKTPCFYYRKP